MVDVNLTAYQNDAALEAAIPANSDEAVDAFMKEIQPGETVNVCQAFSLNDMSGYLACFRRIWSGYWNYSSTDIKSPVKEATSTSPYGKHNEIFYTRKFRLRLSRILCLSLQFQTVPCFCC